MVKRTRLGVSRVEENNRLNSTFSVGGDEPGTANGHGFK
jgi:hypothetical protein